MSKQKALTNLVRSLVELRLSQGEKVVYRKDIFASVYREDPRSDYGCGNPYGRDINTAMLKGIAAELGGRYVKDAAKGPKAKARLVFA